MKKKILLSIIFIICFIFGISNVKAAPTASDVAEINGSYFKSIGAAINSLTDDTETTIILLKDRTENITIPEQRNIILDLNGYTLRNNGTKATVVTNNGKLEIKNGTVTSDASSGIINNNSKGILTVNSGSYIATGSRQVFYNNGGILTISGSTYIESYTTERASVHNLNNGKLYITGGTIIANNSYAVYNDKGTLDIGIENEEYVKTTPFIQGKTYGVIANNSINIYDGIIKGKTYHLGIANSSNAPTVSDDIGETKVNKIEEYSEKVLGEEVIGGETYKTFTYNLDNSNRIQITFDPNGGEVTPVSKKIFIGDSIGTLPVPTRMDHTFDGWFTDLSGGSKITKNTKPNQDVTYYAHWTYVDPNTVAYVEGHGLMSLADAFVIGGKIRLEKDVIVPTTLVMNKETTLDLNGHTISLGDERITITNKVTVTDSSSSKNGKITSTSDFTVVVSSSGNLIHKGGTIEGLGTYGAIRNYGTLEIDGGTVESNTSSSSSYTVFNDNTMIMTSGTIHSLNDIAVQVYKNATFEMNGGLIKTDGIGTQALNLYGDCSVTINDGTIEGLNDNTAGIAMFHNTELIVNGGNITGTAMGIAGNGSESNGNANITINDGNITATVGVGMYLPQIDSTTIINGGSIIGPTGIEIRAGNLIVNDGNITGTADAYEVKTNASGTTTKGAAIGVSQHNTKKPIEVTINAGNMKAKVPLGEANPMSNPLDAINQISIVITNGNFESTGDKVIDAENEITIIQAVSGGTYTYAPTEYVTDGYGVVKISDNLYEVTKIHNITIDTDSTDIISVDNTQYPHKSVVTVNTVKKFGYDVVLEVIGVSGNKYQAKGNSFIMPDEDVIVYAKHAVIINPITGDKVLSYVLLLEMSIIGLLSIKVYYTKRKDI